MTEYDDKSYYEIQLEQKQLVLILLLMVAICVLFFFLGVYYVKAASRCRRPARPPPPPPRGAVSSRPRTARRRSRRRSASSRTTKVRATPPRKTFEGGEVVAESRPASERTPPPPTPTPSPTPLPPGHPDKVHPPPAVTDGFVVQIAAVSDQARATKVEGELKAKGFPAHVKEMTSADGARLYKVRVGPYADRGDADKAKDGLRSQGYGGAFVSSDD